MTRPEFPELTNPYENDEVRSNLQHLAECYRPEGDGVRFLDVFTGEPFQRNKIPTSVLQDPLAGSGLRTLQRLSQEGRLTLHFIPCHHGSAQHMQDALAQHPILQTAAYIGVESDWRLYGNTGLPEIIPDEHNSGRREFQAEQIASLNKPGKILLPCEYGQHENTPIYRHVLDMWDIYTWAKDAPLNEAERNRTRNAAYWACQGFRRLTMPGRLGAWLGVLDNNGGLRASANGKVDVILQLGSDHLPTAETLSANSINVAVHETQHEDRQQATAAYSQTFQKVMSTGYASNNQLNTPLPF